MCRSKHVEPSINFGIINSITKLHLVGISTESSTMHGSMNNRFWNLYYTYFIYAVVTGLEVRFSIEVEIYLFSRRRASRQSTAFGEDKAAGT